jgi:hypothetical protein
MSRFRMIFIGLFLIITFMLNGCKEPIYFIYSKDYSGFNLHQVAIYNVPGGEVPVSLVEEIEKDTYGRILFSYTVKDDFHPISAYVICQKTDDEFVYYYEDKCVLVAESFSDISKDALDMLKSQNDWEKPFLKEKCVCKTALKQKRSARDYNTVEGFELGKSVKFSNKIREVFKENGWFQNDDNSLLLCYYAGKDSDGRVLYYVETVANSKKEQTDDNGHRYYAIILENNCTYNDNSCIVIDDFYNCNNDIRRLKEHARWNKGRQGDG